MTRKGEKISIYRSRENGALRTKRKAKNTPALSVFHVAMNNNHGKNRFPTLKNLRHYFTQELMEPALSLRSSLQRSGNVRRTAAATTAAKTTATAETTEQEHEV